MSNYKGDLTNQAADFLKKQIFMQAAANKHLLKRKFPFRIKKEIIF